MRFATKAIHAGQEPDGLYGDVSVPIHLTSTHVKNEKGYLYSRLGNPTRDALEANLAALENAEYGSTFASGMAAIDATMRLVKPGEHAIVSDNVYGGTYKLFDRILSHHGIEFTFVDASNLMNVEVAIKKNTKLVWMETPTNPVLKIVDIEGIARIGKENDIISVIDNTFATPYLQNPLDMGIDIVVHSMTKYLGGHSDVVGGAVLTSSKDYHEEVRLVQKTAGAMLDPFSCFLVLRGTKTLGVRMERHCQNAMKIAEHFSGHVKVKNVIYPGLESHPQHEIARKQMRDFGGMVTFELAEASHAQKLLDNLKIFSAATSLGGVESLIDYPVALSQKDVPAEQRDKLGVTDRTVRLSVGIEDVEDLIQDLERALG
jgi:cystathionine gamma-lyase